MTEEKSFNAKTTSKHLSEYLGDLLKEKEIDSMYAAYSMEYTFGVKIHNDVDKYIKESKDNNTERSTIRLTLVHDMVGGINNDKRMLPRVSR